MKVLSKSIRRITQMVMLTLLGFQSMTPAMASVRDEDFTLRTPVSDAVLDSMRGGFQRDADGPFISFGIERNVFLNEKLVSSTVLNVPDMRRFADRDWNPFADQRDVNSFGKHSDTRPIVNSPDTKPFADHPSETFTLIQSGPGNSLPHDVSSLPPFTTIIQNSLDNRTIQSETVINATVEALTWARSLHLSNALSQANMEAIRH